MTCEQVRNLLLYVPDPHRVPGDLRSHLDACPGCTAALADLVRLEHAVAAIPVPPSSPEAKAALVDQILSPEPIIAHVPAQPRTGIFDRLSVVRKEYLVGLAAGLLLAIGGLWLANSQQTDTPNTPAPLVRHDLLGQEVKHLVALANAKTPSTRFAVWSELTTDLHGEIGKVYQHAPADDLRALERMFNDAVNKGIVTQAGQLPAHIPAAERHRLFTDAQDRLLAAETESTRMAAQAPPQTKPVLERLATTARSGREALAQIARGKRD